MEVSLVMFKSDGTRRDFPLKKQRLVVGRTNHCDLRVPLPSVSRQHCEIWVEDDQVHVRDLGSSNGTFHNKERVQRGILKPGDEIMIGPVVFQVIIDGEPAEVHPVHTVLSDQSTSGGSDGTMSDSPTVAADSLKEPATADEGEADALEPVSPLDDDESIPMPLDDEDEEIFEIAEVIEEDDDESVPIALDDESDDVAAARPDRPSEINAIPLEEGSAADVLPVLEDEEDPFAELVAEVAEEDDNEVVMLENPMDSDDPADASGATSNLELNFDDDDPIAALEAMADSESREEGIDLDDEPISLLDEDEDK